MRISLRNFVTYSEIEITPGPNMNMIIGPNGTGKSTIVCAIALGLGEKPALLGRSTTLSEFVKHGCDSGTIELTLASAEGPVTIGRVLVRENNKSHWKINGRAVTFQEVQKTTRALDIQVNNLCQFLPQDRVVEFSKMSTQELLRETQSAVGRDDLLEMQRELSQLRADERTALAELCRGGHDADTMRKQNDVLERDVKRWQERQTAESQLRVLEALIPVMKYKEAKSEHDRAKVVRNQAHAHYQQLKNEAGPAEEEIQALETTVARAEAKRQQLQADRSDIEKRTRQQLRKLEEYEKKQHELNADLDDLKKRAQRRRENIAQLRTEVARLEAAHPADAPVGETDEMRQLAMELRELKLQMNSEIVTLQDEQKELMRSGREVNKEIENRSQQLRLLDDVAARKRNTLRSASADSFRALEWLEANRDRFGQHVFAPICLEASVNAPEYARLVESVVSASTLRTFVTQSDDDYRTFTREVNDRQKLRVDVVSYHKDLDDFRPPQPHSVLQQLGFDGYVLDFVEAPRRVLAALCNRDRIHEIPVARGAVNHELIEAKMLFKEYIADGTRFVITRGRYGSRASAVTSSRVRPQARFLSSGETDEVQAMRERLQTEIGEFRDQLQNNEETMKRLSLRDKKARDKHRTADAREKDLKDQRARLTEQISRWQRNQIHVETKRAQLDTMVADEQRDASRGGGQTAKERKRIEQAIRQTSLDRAQAVCSIAAGQHGGSLVHKLIVASLEGFRASHALSELRAQALRQREAIVEAQQAYEDAARDFEEAKVAARECLAETRRVTEAMDDDERMRVREAQDERNAATVAELEVELHTCRQRLSLASNSGLSARVMEQYEERQAQLAELMGSLQQREHELEKIRKRKRRVRVRWEQPLDALVRRISEGFTAMFDSIGCMGEVHLCRAGDGVVEAQVEGADPPADDEDYSSWGIEIRVAFRRSEQLHALDNHRQSGGERAVSTILYLQSLQTLAAAPFRVVDEINQGMDQRNERLVHRLIVDTACRPGSPQYFLITPKLLQDLEYHPLMRVLCIYNGEWQPESFNFNRYITNARRATVAS
ncbi:Structural maintenance of chromosomes protein 5 [Coemansia sp. RSA 1933]|nr:Structural maintenance of chromosomes protein 5 [Coemansia sp. RSA 1933]